MFSLDGLRVESRLEQFDPKAELRGFHHQDKTCVINSRGARFARSGLAQWNTCVVVRALLSVGNIHAIDPTVIWINLIYIAWCN